LNRGLPIAQTYGHFVQRYLRVSGATRRNAVRVVNRTEVDEQQNLALGTAQLVAEGFCKLYGCKSSTNNDDSHFLIISLRQWYSPMNWHR
jgi:hypothetical protein